ncbi:glyceraldehyde-3-phosphate dehydrogenase [Desulfoluna limicola]|uniref:Glyceraldehyde-3-phosphate dehydrogenase n=1 Tax=Desulfoluna limicola TaxID=2810562 RepID=A0ABN6EYS2_9BACT|nr:type I glyceraldehyde-3-phosphate dehydrogenase [Desulfoluna limicola]BCS94633.1 glyceraldehyde-3-phosphate dehydrogenase [Desulfoluna limicola]
MSINIGINGFGRIGRMVFRAALNNPAVEVVAINDLTDIKTIAHLLAYDSVHGRFDGEVEATENGIIVNGKTVRVTAEKDPANLPWKELDVTIAMECTGIFRDREGASKHLAAGAKKVIISAPAVEPDATIVMGVNDATYDAANHHIVSNASCTTNCLAPVAKVLHETFGIKEGLMTTIHAYTGDQRILDAPHKDLRRARAAGCSMVPTTTGAAKAVALVLPELKGKLNGMSIRVPTPNVSLVDLVVNLEKPATKEEINAALKKASENELKGILDFCDLPLVSIDFNGSPASSSVDAPSTDVMDGMVKVLSWYDNEAGYSNRMVDLAAMIASKL